MLKEMAKLKNKNMKVNLLKENINMDNKFKGKNILILI